MQGKKGVVRKESEVKDPKRFNMKEPLSIKNGLHVVVSNQWGENILDFIAASEDEISNFKSCLQEQDDQETLNAL